MIQNVTIFYVLVNGTLCLILNFDVDYLKTLFHCCVVVLFCSFFIIPIHFMKMCGIVNTRDTCNTTMQLPGSL